MLFPRNPTPDHVTCQKFLFNATMGYTDCWVAVQIVYVCTLHKRTQKRVYTQQAEPNQTKESEMQKLLSSRACFKAFVQKEQRQLQRPFVHCLIRFIVMQYKGGWVGHQISIAGLPNSPTCH